MTTFLWNQFYAVFGLLVLTTCIVALIGERLVVSADRLALKLGISGGLVGFILVAAVTSVPEMVSTFVAAADNHPALAAGNIYGSNSANVAFLALIFLITGKTVPHLSKESLAGVLGSLFILAIVTTLYFLMVQGVYNFNEVGLALGIFVIYLLLMRLNYSIIGGNAATKAPKQASKGAVRSFVFYSMLIVVCAWGLVIFCERMAQLPFPGLGKPLGAQFIGTLILAVSTSVPEIVTTYAMVKKGYTDMAFGNIFGSNVFNLMVFCIAPLFGRGVFWQNIPISLLYTALAIFLVSVLMGITTLITKGRHQRGALAAIVLTWVVSLFLVF